MFALRLTKIPSVMGFAPEQNIGSVRIYMCIAPVTDLCILDRATPEKNLTRASRFQSIKPVPAC